MSPHRTHHACPIELRDEPTFSDVLAIEAGSIRLLRGESIASGLVRLAMVDGDAVLTTLGRWLYRGNAHDACVQFIAAHDDPGVAWDALNPPPWRSDERWGEPDDAGVDPGPISIPDSLDLFGDESSEVP